MPHFLRTVHYLGENPVGAFQVATLCKSPIWEMGQKKPLRRGVLRDG